MIACIQYVCMRGEFSLVYVACLLKHVMTVLKNILPVVEICRSHPETLPHSLPPDLRPAKKKL